MGKQRAAPSAELVFHGKGEFEPVIIASSAMKNSLPEAAEHNLKWLSMT